MGYRQKITLFQRKGKKVYYFYFRDAEGNRVATSTGKTVKSQARVWGCFLQDKIPQHCCPV